MDKNIERIDHYLKNVALPEPAPGSHRHKLRRQVLSEIERKQTMSTRVTDWRHAALIALIGSGIVAAAVVGVTVRKYYFVRKDPEYGYLLCSEDGRFTTNIPARWADSPEEALKIREELALLKQQGPKELVSVQETEVNGQVARRVLGYAYTLSNGRTVKLYEYDPDTGSGALDDERMDEVQRCWEEALASSMYYMLSNGQRFGVTADGREILTHEREVQGLTFSFERIPFTLSDGTEAARSIGRPVKDGEDAAAARGGDQSDTERERKDLLELTALRRQGQRQVIGVDILMANGELDRKVFVYRYQLSDGRTMDMREGADGNNYILTPAQRREWVQSRDAGSGKDLGTYEEDVEGRTFMFEKKQYTLADGTEILWSMGKPKTD